MKVKSYKELNIWQKGLEIVEYVYKITDKLPQKELYVLASQMQRSAISIPSNIAEGFVRGHSAEYRQFLRIALGSCAELETQLIIAHKRNYTTKMETEGLHEQLDHESRMIMNLIKSLNKSDKSRP
jgi:four helix bundle protein